MLVLSIESATTVLRILRVPKKSAKGGEERL
jgi:hypothetical protein